MNEKAPIERARPLLEDWAKETGVTVEWFHEWARGQLQHVTAFGFDADGVFQHNTVTTPMHLIDS